MNKKMYVCSGQLQEVVTGANPIDCISIALERGGGPDLMLDSTYVYLDERGFRADDTAQYKVPVEQALTEAGYIFDDEDEGEDFLPLSEWSPSVEE